MIYTKEATGAIDDVCKRIEQASASYKFSILGTHDLKAKIVAKEIQFGKPCRVIEVCDPLQAKRVLDGDMILSTVLPCRISVYAHEGKVMVATLKPTELVNFLGHEDLTAIAGEVEESLVKIIDMACTV